MIIYGWGGSYNKRDWTYRWGACENCGHVGHLPGFTSSKFFNIYYIPIIPHGNQRVMDHCPSCKSSRSMPLAEWKQMRRGTLQRALKAFEAAPDDPELAEEARNLVIALGDEAQFNHVALMILADHAENAHLMAGLGHGLAYFGRLEEAQSTLRQSLELEPDDEIQQTLDFFSEQTIPPPPKEPGLLNRFGWLLILPAILLLIFAALVFKGIGAKPQNVFLVSGLDVAYSVMVNGEEFELAPHGRVRLPLEFGPVSVRTRPGAKLSLDPLDAVIDAGFFSRASSQLVFIINPDRVALLTHDSLVYTSSDAPEQEPEMKLLVGLQFYAFDDVDYPFVPSPESIDIKSGRTSATRVALDHVSEDSVYDKVNIIWEMLGKQPTVTWIKASLELVPENPSLLSLASALLEPADGITLAKPLLARRPVLVEWHRAYQTWMGMQAPETDLLADYLRLHEAEPKNNSITYLMARLIPDPGKSFEMFQLSTHGNEPEPYGYYALAFALAARCRLDEALVAIDRAVELRPQQRVFEDARILMLRANHKWDDLIAHCRRRLEANPVNAQCNIDLIAMLTSAKKIDEAERLKKRYLDRLAMPGDAFVPPATRAEIQAQILATQALFGEEPKALTQAASKIEVPLWKLRAALAAGDIEQASKLWAEDPSLGGGPIELLGLYAVATEQGTPDLAEQQLQSALEQLGKGDADSQRLATWFAKGAKPPGLQETYGAATLPSQRKLLLTALGLRHPSSRKEFHHDARILNFDRDAWFFPLREILDATR